MTKPDAHEEIAVIEQGLANVISTFENEPVTGEVPKWVLPPRSCRFLEEVLKLLPEGSGAFEFGSGQSTHAMRRFAAHTTSIEDSEEWLRKTEAANGSKRPGDRSEVVPLTRCWNRLRPIESFPVDRRADVLNRLKEARLVLVDSPPNPAKREAALFLALKYSPVGAVIVLDDLDVRATDRFAKRLARQNGQSFRFWKVRIDHDLGVFLKLRAGRVRSLPSMREFVGTWMRA